MINTNCNCHTDCVVKAIIASAVIGVVAAVLRFTAIITVTPAFLWVLFGIAVGYIGVIMLTSSAVCPAGETCCRNLTALLSGALGTILTSLVLLGITFAATSELGAIITGFLLFFFSLLIISSVCFIYCRYRCDD